MKKSSPVLPDKPSRTELERRIVVLEAVLGVTDNGFCQGKALFCPCDLDQCSLGDNIVHRLSLGVNEIIGETHALRMWLEEAERWGFIPKEVRILSKLKARRRYLSEQVENFRETQLKARSLSLETYLASFQSKVDIVDQEILSITEQLENLPRRVRGGPANDERRNK